MQPLGEAGVVEHQREMAEQRLDQGAGSGGDLVWIAGEVGEHPRGVAHRQRQPGGALEVDRRRSPLAADPDLHRHLRRRPQRLAEDVGQHLDVGLPDRVLEEDLDHAGVDLPHRHGEELRVHQLAQGLQRAEGRLMEVVGGHSALQQGIEHGRLEQRGVEVAGHPGEHLDGADPLRVEGTGGGRARRGVGFADQTSHGLDQLPRPVVLGEVGVGAGAQAPVARRRLAVAGEDQHRHVGARRIGLEQPQQGEAVHGGHLEVGHHHRRPLAQRRHRPLGAVARLQHLEAGAAQGAGEDRPRHLAVIDHQHPPVHRFPLIAPPWPPIGGRARGRARAAAARRRRRRARRRRAACRRRPSWPRPARG